VPIMSSRAPMRGILAPLSLSVEPSPNWNIQLEIGVSGQSRR
jgi:hypothetical protein